MGSNFDSFNASNFDGYIGTIYDSRGGGGGAKFVKP